MTRGHRKTQKKVGENVKNKQNIESGKVEGKERKEDKEEGSETKGGGRR